MDKERAYSIIEKCYGFSDETSSAGGAWGFIKKYINFLEQSANTAAINIFLKSRIAMKEQRKLIKLNQTQLAKIYNASEPLNLKITRGLLSKYETGEVMPPADKYLKLMNVLEKAKNYPKN